MDNTFEKYERIEAYLSGRLSGKELEVFESEMNADPELAEEVALQQGVFEALKDKQTLAFRKTLEAIRDKRAMSISAVRKKPISLGRIFSIAATVLVLITAGIWLWNTNPFSTASPFELSVNNFEAPENLNALNNQKKSSFRGKKAGEGELELWSEIESLYQSGQFQEGYEKLAGVPNEIYEDYASEINYQMGVLAFRLDKPEQAVKHFEKVEVGYADSKRWYKALALLRIEGQLPQAKATLEEIINSNSPKKDQAAKILKRLD
jgi:tetratricopeptide (TPR) repeat protein